MSSPDRAPEIFSHPSETTLRIDQKFRPVNVTTSPDGGYLGNGEFKNAKDKTFEVPTGFDKTGPVEIWFYRGFIKVSKHPCAGS